MKAIDKTRNKIQSDVESYLRSGGEIQEIPTGVSGEFKLTGAPRAHLHRAPVRKTQKQVRDALKRNPVIRGAW
jgi:hypothetical protein